MKVKKLTLENFRGIARMELEFHERVNVLMGENGTGKSAILDCLAILLSRLIGRIKSTAGTGRFFVEYDITNGQKETKNEIWVEIDEQSVSWSVTKTRRGRKTQTITNQEQLKGIVQKIQADYESDEALDFPLAVYYPVNRAVLDIPLRIRRRHQFHQLSDGEKCQLALAGDLARRLAIANPSLRNPRNGQAVVLIDEVDLHLHPSWQRTIVPRLTETFPNCQFIVTTHSPQIASEVDEGMVALLKRTAAGVSVLYPEGIYGHDTNRILEDFMGVAERPQPIKDALTELFRVIEESDLEGAKTIVARLNDQIGSDPQLTRARTMIRRKEILGK